MKKAAATKKAKVEGTDITRFFDRAQQAEQEVCGGHTGRYAASPLLTSPPGQGPAAPSAGDHAPRHAAASTARSALHKHLTRMHDFAPPDSFVMSQDTDAMQVVWQDSPGASSQSRARPFSNLGRPMALAGGVGMSSGTQELSAIKQRLISAAQRPRDVRRAGPVLAGGPRLQQGEQLLEGLLAAQQQQPTPHQQHRPAQGPLLEHSNLSGAQSDLGPAAGGQSNGGTVSGVHRTPATHLRSILKRRGGGGSGSRCRQTPASSVKFSLNDSGGKALRTRTAAAISGSSGKKRRAGQKRKALLELLEQVEHIVHSGPSTQDSDDDEERQEQLGQQGCKGEHMPNAEDVVPQPWPLPGAELATVSDKENCGDAAVGGARPCGSQGQAVAADGPTGSQQLMPPPGGVGYCGGQRPAQLRHHQQALPPVAQQLQAPLAAARLVPGSGAPAAAPFAGMHQAPPRAAGASGQAGSRSGGQVQNVSITGSSGMFGDEDEDEDDALMARLELELLTQVELRQAVAKQGQGQGLGQVSRQVQGQVQAQRQVQWQGQGPTARAAAARPVVATKQGMQWVGHDGTTPAPTTRLQAAPPAAQHPAAALEQRQQLHNPSLHAAVGRQARRLPRSPYERTVKMEDAGVAAGPAAPGNPVPGPAAVTTHAALKVLVPACAAVQGFESSWDDDSGFDADLLDQFEAAALKERAERSLQPTGAAGGRGSAAELRAEGSDGPPAAAAVLPVYPGGREEVYYEIRGIYQQPQEQVLLLHNKYQKRDVYAHLHPPWADLPYRVGDPVNLLAPLDLYEGCYHCLLNMEHGMIIMHPDLLLSGTRITTSHECPRRSFLDERVAGDGSNDKAVKGTLTHNLIQAVLTEGLRTPPQLVSRAATVVLEASESLLEVGLSEEAALECLKQAVPGIHRWMHRFLRPDPAPDSLLGAGLDYATGRDIRRKVAVQEVVDIEESIWSTKYGVKGMIDVSAQLVLDEAAQAQRGIAQPAAAAWMQGAVTGAQSTSSGASGTGRQVAVAPVEIKTGKMHDSHRAQVLLYLLLMEERYGRPLDWGMLWYTTQADPQLVMKRPTDLSCLMAVRNRLAAAIAHKEMPPLAEEKRQCNWCFQQLNCALAHKAELGEAATTDTFVRSSTDRGGNLDRFQAELAERYQRAAGHMTPADCQFLRKWQQLVTLEEGHSAARRPEIWAMPGQERQQLGRCVAGLVLTHVDEQQLLYTFRCADGGAVACSFHEGEMLLLSVEGRHAAVARGHFYTCTASHLTISLNKALRRGLLKFNATRPVAAAAAVTGTSSAGTSPAFDGSVCWRLDRDDVSSTFVRLRGNLFALFRCEYECSKDPQTNRLRYGSETPESQHAAKLRRLIVGLEAPRFGQREASQPDPTPRGMNSEQHEAVQRVVGAHDYTLVLGMPGAGKTTTIVSMVQALVSQGKSVLLTSYTNSAVDNILMKLAGQEVPFVRLGRESGVHPAVRPWVPGGERYPRKTTRDLAALAASVPVFGATCFGVGHPMLKGRLFDVCIIDEAGQMVLPAALGPLLRARTFVLVGDHNQLPPLVVNREAEAGGLGESLFKRLSDAHPQAVVSLPVQYRMAADIMVLPNALIYNNALRCGTDSVAQAALQLPPSAAAVLATLPSWLEAALAPERRVLFLDTAGLEGARESAAGDVLSNGGEAKLVLQLLRAAVGAGVGQERMGVISPYRSQVALLERLARGAGLCEIEVLTVDKCQGRDKDFIIISLVRSNADAEAGKLLADWRRINVAITRARCKLVLLGDAATLRSIQLFARLLDLVRSRGWYMQLPEGAVPPPPTQLPQQ